MNPVDVLQKEYDKVDNKHGELKEGLSNIDDLIAAMDCTHDKNKDLDIGWLLDQTKQELNNISSSHKDWHGSISRFGKVIDKQLTENVSLFSNKDLFAGENAPLLYQLICEHFLRQGRLDLVEEFVKESGFVIDESNKQPFTELNEILESLKRNELKLALHWCENHRLALKNRSSSLEFMLHRLQFIELLQKKDMKKILEYSHILGRFADTHRKPLQRLMGSLLYAKEGLDDTPYSDLLKPLHWLEICDTFTKDACALMGLSKESPLSISINSGCKALPALNQIRQVMEAKQLWGLKDELPCEVDLGPSCQFHSLFACPILRAQCTKTNAPMRLSCGHVISNDALKRLTTAAKVKCPYCPMETNPTEAKEIHF